MTEIGAETVAPSPVAGEIREFLRERVPLARDLGRIGDDDSLLDAGVIDSMGVLELVDFIDERYGIAVREEDLVPENFDSISGIVDFVGRSRPQ